MKINKDWHLRNKMPNPPTFDQRVAWHKEHQKHCSCRPIPKKLLEEIFKYSKTKISKDNILQEDLEKIIDAYRSREVGKEAI